jgi:hypothetical protein
MTGTLAATSHIQRMATAPTTATSRVLRRPIASRSRGVTRYSPRMIQKK